MILFNLLVFPFSFKPISTKKISYFTNIDVTIIEAD